MEIEKKKLRILPFFKAGDYEVPYVVFTFRIPEKVFYHNPVEAAMVLCRPPHIGSYLESDIKGSPIPYIDFLPLGKTTPGTRSYTKVVRVRCELGRQDNEKPAENKIDMYWDMEYQRMAIMERGTVFAIADIYLRKEFMIIHRDASHPISLKSGFEST